ncbi:phage terminase large subunit [Burkholderia pseudomallei]
MKLRPPTPPSLWAPLPKQRLALECPVDDMLFGGSVGGGKTDFLLAAWVQHAARYAANAVGLIVRRTLPELRDISRRALRLFPKLGAVWKTSERTWTFPNGATLLLGYLESEEDATRYQGQEYTFVGVDEAGAFKSPEPIDYLRSRMRSPIDGVRKQLILTANPGGRGHKWLMERYVKGRAPYVPFEAKDDEGNGLGFLRVYIPSRLTDNPYLMKDPAYVQRILASGPRWLVRALLLGDWNIQLDAGVLRREWWKDFTMLPVGEPIHIIQSWDTSYGKRSSQNGDRSVCSTWFVYQSGYYLVDVWAKKVEFPELKKAAIDLAAKWGCYDILIEDAASGQSLIQELQRETTLAIRPVKVDTDKVTRAYAVSPLVESGRVFIPGAGYTGGPYPIRPADWRSDMLDETSAFPQAAHDDIVDSITQALKQLASRYVVGEHADNSYTLDDIYAAEE